VARTGAVELTTSLGSAEHPLQAVGCGVSASSTNCLPGSAIPTPRAFHARPPLFGVSAMVDLGVGISNVLSSNANDSVSTPDNSGAHLGFKGPQHVYTTCPTLFSFPCGATRDRLEERRLSSQIQRDVGILMIDRLQDIGNDRPHRGDTSNFTPEDESADALLPVWERGNCGIGERTKRRLREVWGASRVGSGQKEKHDPNWASIPSPLHADVQLALQALRSS